MKARLAAISVAAIAVLFAGSITNSRAIGVQLPNGRMIELGSLSGVVSQVNPNKHNFTLKWQHKGNLQMEHYYPSYQQQYEVTDATVFTNGSWDNVQKGTHVQISGRSFIASSIVILDGSHPASATHHTASAGHHTLNAEVFSN
jgi:hypothetical protein